MSAIEMWRAVTHGGGEGTGDVRVARLEHSAQIMSKADVFTALERDPEFRAFYTQLLAGDAMSAFFWELPRLTRETLSSPFEHVLLESDSLSRLRPSPASFGDRFDADPTSSVLTFPNLGGDAELVVPRPLASHAAYPHLAAFLRGAPAAQQHALWRVVATTLRQVLARRPTWLSTAGLGVPWLHLRFDSRPKYYRHAPYRRVG